MLQRYVKKLTYTAKNPIFLIVYSIFGIKIVFLFKPCIIMYVKKGKSKITYCNEEINFDDAVAFGLNSIVCSGTLG